MRNAITIRRPPALRISRPHASVSADMQATPVGFPVRLAKPRTMRNLDGSSSKDRDRRSLRPQRTVDLKSRAEPRLRHV